MLRLTILLLKAVLAHFLRQERYLPIHTRPLVDGEFSTHQTLKEPTFVTAPNLLVFWELREKF